MEPLDPSIAKRLADIRERSAEYLRVIQLPPFDPVTGVPRPLLVVSQANMDVAFLLGLLDDAYLEIARLEEIVMYSDEDVEDEDDVE